MGNRFTAVGNRFTAVGDRFTVVGECLTVPGDAAPPAKRPARGVVRFVRAQYQRHGSPSRYAGCSSSSNAESNARLLGLKSNRLVNVHASAAPNSRSIPLSSHSIDNGPS